MDRGIGSWVRRRAFVDGARVAFVEGTREVTYAEFDEATNRLGRGLIDLGVRRGDRIGVLLANSVAFMEVTFAAARLGAIVVPVNFRLQGPEVGFLLADAGADVLVHHDSFPAARAALAEPGVRVRHRLVVAAPGQATAALADGELSYLDVLASGAPDPLDMDVDERDAHAIMYTSGTTGRPKGAVLTHANAVANARNGLLQGRGVRPGDVTVTAAPMFHIGGLGVHSLPFVYVGGTNVILSAFDPPAFLAAVAEHGATVQFLVPAMWAALTRVPDFDRFDLSALDMAVSGGAPTPLPVIEFFNARGITFQEGFGMTETAPSVSVLDADHIKEKLGSIGRPLPGVETRVVDAADRDVATGTVGELVVRGDNVFAGYWMLPDATADAFRGGWFHTGDLARVDDEGYITLVDRKKDMIITGGENVYPVEVEQVVVRHPAVREAAVFGVADERWGETVVAAVALDGTATAAELIAHCRRRLAHFKCPTRIVIVDELPRNATGKVLKTALRATFGTSASAVTR
jgi:fatty-acyl-CoA synthase